MPVIPFYLVPRKDIPENSGHHEIWTVNYCIIAVKSKSIAQKRAVNSSICILVDLPPILGPVNIWGVFPRIGVPKLNV